MAADSSLKNTFKDAMFERETRREKILEARNKELRLKEKTKGILGLGGGGAATGLLALGGGGASDKFGATVASTMKTSTTASESSEKDAASAESTDCKMAEPPEEDPIMKAEKEFFEIIKVEQEARLEQRKHKQEPDKDME